MCMYACSFRKPTRVCSTQTRPAVAGTRNQCSCWLAPTTLAPACSQSDCSSQSTCSACIQSRGTLCQRSRTRGRPGHRSALALRCPCTKRSVCAFMCGACDILHHLLPYLGIDKHPYCVVVVHLGGRQQCSAHIDVEVYVTAQLHATSQETACERVRSGSWRRK